MTLHQLRTFLAVVEHGSVRAAAESLVVSQPAVSAAVGALEHELGVDLVAREGRGLRVTAAGNAFAAAARSGLQHLDHGARLARSVDAPGAGPVHITAIATAAERLLIPLLAGFRKQHADAVVTLHVGNRSATWAALADLDADLVVAGRPPAAMEARVLGRAGNTLALVGPADQFPEGPWRRHVLAQLGRVTWLVREEGSGTRDATDELLADLGLDPPRMVLGSNGAVQEAVAAGFGVGLLPLDAVGPRLAAGAMVRIDCPGTPIDRPWHLVASAAVPLTPTATLAARSLLDRPGGFTPTAEGRRL